MDKTQKKRAKEIIGAGSGKIGTKEDGASGTGLSGGIISDDFNSKFHTGQAAKIYDEMRRTDPMIRATIELVKRPILASEWGINPVDDSPEEIEIANFVYDALENKMDVPFSQRLPEILNYPFMGFYYFEKVLKIEDGKVYWETWGPRVPTAHYKWETNDGQPGVTQQLTAPKEGQSSTPSIPMEKLILFVHEREGENYDGFPILRSVYRSYVTKDMLYRIQVIGAERAAGTLVITLPKNHNTQDKEDAEELGENFKQNEKTYIVKPSDDWKVEIMTAGVSEKSANVENMIRHHNEMIAMNILAHFITLGSDGGSGSYALAKDGRSFFTLGLQAIVKQVSYVVNKQAIEELVRFNFGERKAYPKLEFTSVGEIDYAELSSALVSLAGAGLIEKDNKLKVWTHKTFGLPSVTLEQLEEKDKEEAKAPEEEEKPEVDEDMEEDMGGKTDMTKDRMKEAIAQKEAKVAELKKKIAEATGEKKTKLQAQLDVIQKSIDAAKGDMDEMEEDAPHFCETPHKSYTFAFKPHRALTLAEERIRFGEVSSFFDQHQSKVRETLEEFSESQKLALLAKVEKAIENKDLMAIKDLDFSGTAELKRKLKEKAKDAFDFGKSQAAGEISTSTPSTPTLNNQAITVQVEQMVDSRNSSILVQVKNAAISAITTGIGASSAIFGIKQLFQDATSYEDNNITSTLTGNLLNAGRTVVFDVSRDQIYGLQRSEILDDATCAICMSIDGRVLDDRDPFAKLGEVHGNCRGLWAAILVTDENPPSITGIPKSIKNRFETTEGVPSTNSFNQLKTPQYTKNSRVQQKVDDGKLENNPNLK